MRTVLLILLVLPAGLFAQKTGELVKDRGNGVAFKVPKDWVSIPVDPLDKMTLRHLLTHSAGFPLYSPLFGADFAEARDSSLEEDVLGIQQVWLKFRVGERGSYSNPSINLAAYILQVQSGRPFEQYVKEKVFDPLGMPDSSLDYGFVKDHPHRAQGHSTNVSEFPIITSMAGASGVHTTARDLSRFVRFHLNRGTLDGQTILEPRFLDAMYTTSPISSLTWSKNKDKCGLCVFLREKHDFFFFQNFPW